MGKKYVKSISKSRTDKFKTNRIMTYEEVTDKTNDIVTNGKYQEGDIFHENSWIYIISKDSNYF
jgi:hypothetical protein